MTSIPDVEEDMHRPRGIAKIRLAHWCSIRAMRVDHCGPRSVVLLDRQDFEPYTRNFRGREVGILLHKFILLHDGT
jgi:hypothetical protein